MMRKFIAMCALASCLLFASCSHDAPMPLPLGYYRIDLPEPEYSQKNIDCPFGFEISKLSRLEFYESGKEGQKCWFDLYYPSLKARLHFTYKEVDGDLRGYIEESRSMTYEHHIKASRIVTDVLSFPERDVYGVMYSLEGNVASPLQFYLTDSTNHFFRGSLYFETKPNQDSLKPVLKYVQRDMKKFVASFDWK